MLKLFKKPEEKTTTASIAVWYTFSNVLTRGIAFVTTPIFTRMLSKSQFGMFSNFTSWQSILFTLVTLDLAGSVARAKYDYDEKMDEYMSSIMLAGNITTLISYVIVELFPKFFMNLFSMDMLYIRLLFLYIMFQPTFSCIQRRHRMYRKYRFVVAFSLTSAILRTGVSVLLVYFMQDKLMGRIFGYVIPITIFNVALWLRTMYKGRSLKWEYIKYACILSVPLIPHSLSNYILGSSDKIMITRFCGAEQTALYSLSYSVSAIATLLWSSMNNAWGPWLNDNIHANNRKAIDKNSKIYLGTFALLVIAAFLITPEMVLILGGKQYYEARFVMPPVIMGHVFQFIYAMYVDIEFYEKKTIWISVGTIGSALLNMGLNIIFIPRFGYMAAAYTTMVGYAALFVFHFMIVRFVIPGKSNLYSKRFIGLIIIGMMGVAAISMILYLNNTVRYITLASYAMFLCLFGLKYKETIFKLFGIKR